MVPLQQPKLLCSTHSGVTCPLLLPVRSTALPAAPRREVVNHSPTGPQAAFVRGKSPLVAKFLQRDQRLIPDLFKLTLLQLLKPINGNPT
jgi:hypothetical protein